MTENGLQSEAKVWIIDGSGQCFCTACATIGKCRLQPTTKNHHPVVNETTGCGIDFHVLLHRIMLTHTSCSFFSNYISIYGITNDFLSGHFTKAFLTGKCHSLLTVSIFVEGFRLSHQSYSKVSLNEAGIYKANREFNLSCKCHFPCLKIM